MTKLYVKNGFYHVYNRGNNKQNIFTAERDYQVFVNLLYRNIKDTSIKLVGYCLMPNHYHMLLKNCTNEPEIPQFMQCFMTGYVMYFNRRYRRVGGLFQSRFQAKRLPTIHDLENAKAYLVKNPYELDAKVVRESYRWLYIAQRLKIS